jgi:hypothetical protein
MIINTLIIGSNYLKMFTRDTASDGVCVPTTSSLNRRVHASGKSASNPIYSAS